MLFKGRRGSEQEEVRLVRVYSPFWFLNSAAWPGTPHPTPQNEVSRGQRCARVRPCSAHLACKRGVPGDGHSDPAPQPPSALRPRRSLAPSLQPGGPGRRRRSGLPAGPARTWRPDERASGRREPAVHTRRFRVGGSRVPAAGSRAAPPRQQQQQTAAAAAARPRRG